MSQKKGSKGYNPVSAAAAKKKREQEAEEDRFGLFRYTRPRKLPWAARQKAGSPGGRSP